MSEFFSNMAQNAGQGLIGGFLGNFFNDLSRRQDLKYYKHTADYNAMLARQNARFFNDLSHTQWLRTNFSAQLREMKKAGLSPGLMLSPGAGGGAQPMQGGSPGGTNPNANFMSIGLDMMRQKAEIDNLNANTEKTLADAEFRKGVETESTKANIANTIQDTKNKRAIEQGQYIDNFLNSTEAKYRGKTLEANLDVLKWTVNKIQKEVSILNSEDYVQQNIREERIRNAQLDNMNTFVSTQLMNSNIEVNKVQIDKFNKEIWQMVEQINLLGRDISTKEEANRIRDFEAELRAKYPSIMNALGSGANDFMQFIRIMTGSIYLPLHDSRNN